MGVNPAGHGQVIHDLLRWQVRESRGRHEDPSAVVLDIQTVGTSLNAPAGPAPDPAASHTLETALATLRDPALSLARSRRATPWRRRISIIAPPGSPAM